MINSLIAANLIVLFSFFVRSFSGFGGALLCIPLLALFYDLKFIVPIECILEIILSLILIPRIIKDVDKQNLALMLVGAILGSLAGIYLLKTVANATLKMILGVVVIVVALNLLRAKVHESKPISRGWGLVAGVIGGILGGMFGTSGPPYVTYLAYQSSPRNVFRATLILIFAIESTWRLIIFCFQGMYSRESLTLALWLAPATVIATLVGHAVQVRFNERRFHFFVCGLLIVSGLLCFIRPAIDG